MAFFNAHDAERLGAIGHRVKFFSGLHQAPDHCICVARWNGELICQLSRKRDPKQPGAQPAANGDIGAGHEGEGLIGQVKFRVDNFLQQPPRVWPSNCILRPGLGG